jgi:hypothetical protein
MNDRERRIRERAFDLWQQGGGQQGQHAEHWVQAEREIDEEDKAGTAGNKPESRDSVVVDGTPAAKAGPKRNERRRRPKARQDE